MSQAPEIPEITDSKGISQYVYELSATPYPAWALAAGLVTTPLIRPTLVPAAAVDAAPKSTFGFGGSKLGVKYPGLSYPTNLSCLLFGATSALGGYMIYDNDLQNGSGFLAVWSLLYPIVNGRKAIWTLKLWPKLLAGQALINAGLYGRRFIWP
ncbi:unnamed protein product [Kuraishia capsulata CBS 1993]|uniref:Altered inheritance of mitochondria protein 19 n=1 Tax=Kuraishia capsulata CBS 1993 TaxID=1382522 RepID=W6MMD0_9ASCO|nr:uncharacterized protein KUCA_T00003675001 [Kuraishia capsulata CBS 1993]CDK27696.1 unnamed protein product [Kuraishia capsulata CBS 1993]